MKAQIQGSITDTAKQMDFDDAFRARLRDLLVWRRDVRRFRRDPLPRGMLERLIQLACLAPSVGLSQPWPRMPGSSSPAWTMPHLIWRCSPILRPRRATASGVTPCRR